MGDIFEEIGRWLQSQGFELGCCGECAHSCGLPPGVRVKPAYTPVDGAHTLLVTSTEVLPATCRYPSNFNDWRITRRVPYSSREELKTILERLTAQPRGCW